jgi:DNA-binding LacI/PurR family transcriptional regulator
MGDVFMTMQKEITSQTLKRSFYPVWIPESLFDLGTTQPAPDNKEFLQFLEYTVNNMPHGILIWGERFIPYDMLERNLAKCGRLVFFGDYVHTKEILAKYVLIDYVAAAQKVVSCFQKNGHKKITLLSSPVTDIEKFTRKPPQYFYHKALERACADAGIEYDSEVPKMLWLSKPQEEVFQTILRRKITAAAMVSDAVYYAYCADTIQKMKIRIPEDLSLIGFFDVKDKAPDLTTLNIQEHKIATITADMLFEKSDEVRKIFVPPELIERKTVKNLNQAGH